MNQRVFQDLRIVVQKLNSATFSQDDVYMLIAGVREELAGRRGIVWELGNFCIHSNKRDRKDASAYFSRIIEDMAIAQYRGTSYSVKPLYEQAQIIGELGSSLRSIGLPADQASLARSADDIMLCMVLLLQGVIIYPETKWVFAASPISLNTAGGKTGATGIFYSVLRKEVRMLGLTVLESGRLIPSDYIGNEEVGYFSELRKAVRSASGSLDIVTYSSFFHEGGMVEHG